VIYPRDRAVAAQRMHGSGPHEFFAKGRGPALVAFHGFGGTASELLPVLHATANAGFTVDAALLPGHGRRIEDLQRETFASWLEHARMRAAAVAREHGPVVLLGFSMGSLVALHVASERPAWLAGVVAMGNALTLRAHTSVPLGLWSRTGWAMPDLYLRKPFSGDLVDPTLAETLATYDHHPMRAALEVYRAGPLVEARLDRVACPVLALHGRRDRVCHWRNAVRLARGVASRDVTVRLFERSAHVLACDGEREDVAAEVVCFLRRLERPVTTTDAARAPAA
jgi:carboxylesterase